MSYFIEYVSIICSVLLIIKISNETFQFLQQSHYNIRNSIKFIRHFYIKDKINYLLYFTIPIIFYADMLFAQIIYVVLSILILLLKYYKKSIISLKFTARINRVYLLLLIIYTTIGTVLSIFVKMPELLSTLTIISLLAVLISLLASILIWPIEKMIYLKFAKKAKEKLNAIDPIVIGITGSYGKTSTKKYLYELLNNDYITFATEKSYNTLNGVCMNINNKLDYNNEVFICEMGATQKNDIVDLCKLVKPKYGIVIEVGMAHLETFKTIENILEEKMKLIESLPSDGVGIINIANNYIKNYHIKNNCRIIKIGLDSDADYYASNILYSKNGLEFVCHTRNNSFKINTKLLGRHNVVNLLAAIAMALEFKVKIPIIQNVISVLEPVKNRLEIKTIGDITIIDDAFNSNYQGFINALEVLSFFNKTRVLITPGIVEAGSEEKKINYDLAKYIIKACDLVILVKNNASSAIKLGLDEVDFKNVIEVENFQEAYKIAIKDGKSILIENDITDIYKI